MSTLVTTDDIPAADRFDFIRELTAMMWVPMECGGWCPPDYRGEFRASGLGPMQVVVLDIMPITVRRTAELISHTDPDMLKLFLVCAGGTSVVDQGGRQARLSVGEFAFYDTRRPYEVSCGVDEQPTRVMTFMFPPSLLPLSPSGRKQLTAVRIPPTAGMGDLTAQFLLQLARNVEHYNPTEAARLSTAALEVLATRLARELDVGDWGTPEARRQPASVQSRLSATAALLATMCADALMRLGDVREARSWYRTAIQAADDSGERRLQVLVRAQASMLPYYFGDPRQAVSTADAALAIGCSPTPSTALAAAAKARAMARVGAADAARESIKLARRLFDEAGDPDSDAAFRFPAKRLLLYLSGALTWLRDTTAAYEVQAEALRLYGPDPAAPIDPALINLDRAMCLAIDRRAQEAAVTAREAITYLPWPQRTEIILTKAEGIVATVPAVERRGAVTALTECVRDCREHAGTLASRTSALDG